VVTPFTVILNLIQDLRPWLNDGRYQRLGDADFHQHDVAACGDGCRRLVPATHVLTSHPGPPSGISVRGSTACVDNAWGMLIFISMTVVCGAEGT